MGEGASQEEALVKSGPNAESGTRPRAGRQRGRPKFEVAIAYFSVLLPLVTHCYFVIEVNNQITGEARIRKESIGSEPWPGSTSLSSRPMPMLPMGMGRQDRKIAGRPALRPWYRLLL